MDTIFMNSKNSKTCMPHILISSLTDKLDLRRGEKILLHQILVSTIRGKNIKKSCSNNKFKILAPTWNDGDLYYLMDHILYLIFKII